MDLQDEEIKDLELEINFLKAESSRKDELLAKKDKEILQLNIMNKYTLNEWYGVTKELAQATLQRSNELDDKIESLKDKLFEINELFNDTKQ